MSKATKKYLVLALALVASSSIYWMYFLPHWGVAIPNEQLWSYSFQSQETTSYNTSPFSTAPLNPNFEDHQNEVLVYKTSFKLKNPSKISAGFLEYDIAYSAKIIINGKLAATTPKNLISPALKDGKIEIEGYWKPRKVTFDPSFLSQHLKPGINTILLVVTNVTDLKKLDLGHKQLSFRTKGQSNSLEFNLKAHQSLPNFTASELPIFKLNTLGQEIPDEPKIAGHLSIFNHQTGNNSLADSPSNLEVLIERRGNTSQSFAKKSYTFKLASDTPMALLNLSPSKKWVLSGPYADKSLIRNALTYSLFREMGNPAPATQFIDLIINDNYQGIYVLTEKIQLGPHHLNISKLRIDPTDSTLFEGGYLLEIDRNAWRSEYPKSGDNSSIPLGYAPYAPKEKKLNETVKSILKFQFSTLEKALYEKQDYHNHLDLSSFVDYFIITEFTKNIDGYCLSTFLYNEDIKNPVPKFHLGPIWDYNFSLGLTDYRDGFDPKGYVYESTEYIPFWWKTLRSDTTFNQALTTRYVELRLSVLSNHSIVNHIDSLVAICHGSLDLNFKKWTVLGSKDFWPNYFLGKSHGAEIEYLKDWITQRLLFLDTDLLASDHKGLDFYMVHLWNDSEQLKKLKKKATKKGINLREMVKIEAKSMVKQ